MTDTGALLNQRINHCNRGTVQHGWNRNLQYAWNTVILQRYSWYAIVGHGIVHWGLRCEALYTGGRDPPVAQFRLEKIIVVTLNNVGHHEAYRFERFWTPCGVSYIVQCLR